MSKRFVCITSLLIMFSSPAYADDTSVLTQTYQDVLDEYVTPVGLDTFVIPTLKGLNKLDPRIRVADDGARVSVYAGSRLLKTLRKPENGKDVAAWVKLTESIIKAAGKASPELERKDFEIVDTMMAHGIKGFDKDSNYYPDLELSNPPQPEFKPKRAFYDRVLNDNFLYLRLGTINKYTQENVSKSLWENQQIKGVIIDLRGNPGGVLKEAVRVAGMFIDGGIVASTKGRAPDSAEFYNAPAGDILKNKPIVVLIDGQTASSAEVLAAALQEQSRATVIGTDSYGKGTVQKLMKLENNSRLAITNAVIFTPSGNKIAANGVHPDICTSGELEHRDPEKIIARHNVHGLCEKQNRRDADLDLAVAQAYLQKRIKQ